MQQGRRMLASLTWIAASIRAQPIRHAPFAEVSGRVVEGPASKRAPQVSHLTGRKFSRYGTPYSQAPLISSHAGLQPPTGPIGLHRDRVPSLPKLHLLGDQLRA